MDIESYAGDIQCLRGTVLGSGPIGDDLWYQKHWLQGPPSLVADPPSWLHGPPNWLQAPTSKLLRFKL